MRLLICWPVGLPFPQLEELIPSLPSLSGLLKDVHGLVPSNVFAHFVDWASSYL